MKDPKKGELKNSFFSQIQDPLEKALAAKNKGNKYFKGGKYELAIKCYTQAIEVCPEGKKNDLSTFYQNRAAAYEQLEDDSAVLSDCSMALKNNSKYVKAMERRARVLRKQAGKMKDEELDEAVKKLKTSLEDMTAVCILEGFQKQEPMILVDAILKDLGRAEARLVSARRTPTLASGHFIKQYFQSFCQDPILTLNLVQNGDGDNHEEESALKDLITEEKYEEVIDYCSKLIKSEESSKAAKDLAKNLRGTFYILSKEQNSAMTDLTDLIEDESCDAKIRVNCLIKRASIYIQQCKDPAQDPLKAMKDFTKAEELDCDNADVFHHRGQVNLLTEQIEDAAKDFKRAVEINPNFSVAYVQKLYTDYRQAIQQNNQVSCLFTQQTRDFSRNLFVFQESVNNVINLFKQAKDKFPDCVETYALFAQVYKYLKVKMRNFLKILFA